MRQGEALRIGTPRHGNSMCMMVHIDCSPAWAIHVGYSKENWDALSEEQQDKIHTELIKEYIKTDIHTY